MEQLLQTVKKNWGVFPKCSNCRMECRYACSCCLDTFYCHEKCQTAHLNAHMLIGTKTKGTKREREAEVVEINVNKVPIDVWDIVTKYLTLQDLKNLSEANKTLLKSMRRVMLMRYRFVVDDYRAFRLHPMFAFVQHLRLLRAKDVYLLQSTDKFRSLVLPEKFNSSLSDVTWPERCLELTFGDDFNQPVDNLPQSLTHLTFGHDFNQPVDNMPQSLTHLTFGDRFNQPVGNLPQFLTHLTLPRRYERTLNGWPKHVKVKFSY